MPPLSTKTEVDVFRMPITEVDEYGQIDLGSLANDMLRTAIATIQVTKQMGRRKSINIAVDTSEFENPPLMTVELNYEGIRYFLHGISGELAVTITVTKDGSIRIERL